MSLESYIKAMPKVELHVHLEGSVQPKTLLALARKHGISLPADTPEGLREWYRFTDFSHFVEVYLAISDCIRTPEDIEMITGQFFAGQAAQNIRYSETFYTIYTHYRTKKLAPVDQLAALSRGRAWARHNFGVDGRWIFDISRELPAEEGLPTADWAIAGMGQGVVALGLGGPEVDNPPEKCSAAFHRAQVAELPAIVHAGETEGPASIWGALRTLKTTRVGHGVRCLEDPELVEELRARQIPLDVCPTSNVCLHVTPSFEEHPLPRLIQEGLYVTLNSDDPALFNTTLTDEYLKAARAFNFTADDMEAFVMRALYASLLPQGVKDNMAEEFKDEFARLRKTHLSD